jgi:hypothetical protein
MTSFDGPEAPSSPDAMLERTWRRVVQIRRRRRRTVGGAAAVAAVALAIALPVALHHDSPTGVVRVVGPPSTIPVSTTNPSGPTATAPLAGPPSTTPATSTPPSTAPPSSGPPSPPALTACATSDLTASLVSAGGAAGSVGYELTFRNTGDVTCTLQGYPGVSYVTSSTGSPVGAPAGRDSVDPVTTVVLAPQGRAQALLIETDSLNYPPNTCRLTSVIGLRIYPPNQTASLFVAQATRACSNAADPVLQVATVQGLSQG